MKGSYVRFFKCVILLCERPRTIEELSAKLETSPRHVRRMLSYLEREMVPLCEDFVFLNNSDNPHKNKNLRRIVWIKKSWTFAKRFS